MNIKDFQKIGLDLIYGVECCECEEEHSHNMWVKGDELSSIYLCDKCRTKLMNDEWLNNLKKGEHNE